LSTLKFPFLVLLLSFILGCTRSQPESPPPEPTSIQSKSIDPQPDDHTSDEDPQPLPPTVYQDSDGTVRLSPLAAKLQGQSLELNDWDQLVGFKNRDQRALWQMHLSAPGTYRVEVDAICTGPTQEAKMRIHIEDKRFSEGTIQLSDNDQTLVTTRLSEVTLDAPQSYRVEVEMVGIPLIGKFAVSEIRFVPLEGNPLPLPRFPLDDGSGESD